jgi:spore germination cell wall hydrolase CwlJ-like protein
MLNKVPTKEQINTRWKWLLIVLFSVYAIEHPIMCANAKEPENIKVVATETVAKEVIKTQEIKKTPKTFSLVKTNEKIDYTDKDVFCLAKNIYHESRGEPTIGKYAVAQVTINRVNNPKFKDTVCGVVYEPKQFSWANNKKTRTHIPKGDAWRESITIAEKVLNGVRINGMDNALFFHSTSVNPRWRGFKKISTFGRHIFYRL